MSFLGGGVLALGWGVSLATLTGWLTGLVMLTTKSFERQDIN
jgi:thiamine transporter ThiT